ncbi:PKD_channel domain-containing protein [Durusdinium trenchii]|uniref:PKD_channel domain-containing protein n=1 Tax=Durusdinium trenchii TaxID=1381693 RepID=A0ABP0I9N8_9DINO
MSEDGSFWAGLSPYALSSSLPADSSSKKGEVILRLRWIRIYWWLILLLVYSGVLLQSNNNRALSSGVRFEIIEQLFPDWNKAAERTRDGEISPSLKEILHADDVAVTLSLYNDLCANQASTHSSIKDSWECKLFDITVKQLSGEAWDATTNRALPDVDQDAVMIGKRGILETKANKNKTNKDLALQRREEVRQICSDNFFQSHFVLGDDPRVVPMGDSKAFARAVAEVHPGLDAIFDQYLLHNHGMGKMMRVIDDINRTVKEMQEDHAQKVLDGLSTRARKRRHLLTELSPEDANSSPATAVAAKEGDGDFANQSGDLNESSRGAAVHEHVTQTKDPQEPQFGSGCFDPGDVAGLLRDLWTKSTQVSGNLDWGLDEQKAKIMVLEVLPNITNETWPAYWKKMNPNGDMKLSPEEFLDWAAAHLGQFQWPIRGYLNSECRNHHWGLLSLCKPQEISAFYQVAFVHGVGINSSVLQRLNVKLSFTQVAPYSGWYRTTLRIFNQSCLGRKPPYTIYLMGVTILLFSLLVLLDSLATLIMLPINLMNTFRMDLPSHASVQEIQKDFWMKLMQTLDGRGVLTQALPTIVLLTERLVALGFLCACAQAAREAFQPSMLPIGVLGEKCTWAWFNGNKEWIVGQKVSRGITMRSYLDSCSGLEGQMWMTELLFQFIFEDEGCFHALVVGAIMCRLLEAFSLSDRLKWLPRTLFLAKTKLLNFLIAYVCLVAGFSLLMTLYFGDIFQQFSTLDESFYTLLLYSFGVTDRAFLGCQPDIERGSFHLQCALFFYTVFVVTIILNMFTTIVIDAFAAEGDPERYEKIYQEEMHSLTTRLLQMFGKGHLTSRTMVPRQTRPRQATGESESAADGAEGEKTEG